MRVPTRAATSLLLARVVHKLFLLFAAVLRLMLVMLETDLSAFIGKRLTNIEPEVN